MTLVHVVLDRAVRRASSDVAPGPRSASSDPVDKDRVRYFGTVKPFPQIQTTQVIMAFTLPVRVRCRDQSRELRSPVTVSGVGWTLLVCVVCSLCGVEALDSLSDIIASPRRGHGARSCRLSLRRVRPSLTSPSGAVASKRPRPTLARGWLSLKWAMSRP